MSATQESVQADEVEDVAKQDENQEPASSRDIEDKGQVMSLEKGHPQLNSQLLTLLNQARIGDARTLQKMTTAVKRFIYESNLKTERKRNVTLLLEQEDFLQPLLIKCLRSNVSKSPALVGDSLGILHGILESGDTRAKKQQVDTFVESGGAVPLMVKLAGVQDNQYNLNGQAISVLEHLAIRGYRDQLVNCGQPLISALIKVSKKKNCSVELQERMVHITSVLLGQIRKITKSESAVAVARELQESNELAGYQELLNNLPPLTLVKQVIPLLNSLMGCKNDEVIGKTLSCLAFVGCVKGSFECILDSGILKKVPPFLSHKDEIIQFFAITSISSIASLTEKNAITFLKTMKGTLALKDFYLGLISKNETLVWAADQFFSAAVNAITSGECDTPLLNAVLSSGFAHSLVQCLKPGTRDKHLMGSAWALGRISTEAPFLQRRLLVEAGALPFLIEQLKNDNEIVVAMAAVIIGNLVQEKPIVRDRVMSSGAIPLLLDILSRDGISLQTFVSVLASIEMIADVRPTSDPENLKDVPPALTQVLKNRSIKFPEKLIPGIFSIISKLSEHGQGGIKLILDNGYLPRVTSALSSGNVDTVVFALETLESIARLGSKEQQILIMEVSIVDKLIELLQHASKYIRRLSLAALSQLYKGQLTPERRKTIQQMVPQIVVQVQEEDPRNQHPAGLAFQNVLSSFKITL